MTNIPLCCVRAELTECTLCKDPTVWKIYKSSASFYINIPHVKTVPTALKILKNFDVWNSSRKSGSYLTGNIAPKKQISAVLGDNCILLIFGVGAELIRSVGEIQTDEIPGEYRSDLMSPVNYLIWLITDWMTRILFLWRRRIFLFVIPSRISAAP